MDFMELMHRRESCRAYAEKPVDRESIDTCLEAARLSPSASNSQPWRYIAVNDAALVKKMARATQSPPMPINRFADEVPVFIAVCDADAGIAARLGGMLKNQNFAPLDIGISVHAFCLRAAELGLGTCMIGWFDEKQVKELLSVPEKIRVRLIIALGWPKNELPRDKARKPPESVVSYNKY